tara:strand:- start:74 stop:742 length:669 start_codon:yes stop_codon:yes gene_type:complete
MSECHDSDFLNRLDSESQTEDIDPNKFATVYNFMNKVPKFHKYRKNGYVFDDIYAMEDNVVRAAGILITGEEKCVRKNKKRDLRLGDLSYFNNGICGQDSEPSCRGKARSIVVDNLPADRKGNKGLIPSLIGDITDDINPGVLLMDFAGVGRNVNSKCTRRDVVLRQLNPDGSSKQKTVNLCTSSKEDFTNPLNEKYVNNNSYPIISLCIISSLIVSKLFLN